MTRTVEIWPAAAPQGTLEAAIKQAIRVRLLPVILGKSASVLETVNQITQKFEPQTLLGPASILVEPDQPVLAYQAGSYSRLPFQLSKPACIILYDSPDDAFELLDVLALRAARYIVIARPAMPGCGRMRLFDPPVMELDEAKRVVRVICGNP